MSKGMLQKVEQAWQALFDQNSPWYLPRAIQNGIQARGIRPLEGVPLDEVGPVVLFSKNPWGGVSVDLTQNKIDGFESIEKGSLDYKPNAGLFYATVRLPRLKLQGRFILNANPGSASAIETAGLQLNLDGQADSTDAASTGNVTLANNYQTQLVQSDNGRFMVGSYHQFNNEYNNLFSDSFFSSHWTSPANKAVSQRTSDRAQPGNVSQPLTGTVSYQDGGKTMSTSYSSHSFNTQMYAVIRLNALAKNFSTGSKEWTRHRAAATAASVFHTYSSPHASSTQSVSSVLNIVKTSPPPSVATNAKLDVTARLESSADASDRPAWLTQADKNAERILATAYDKDPFWIQKAAERSARIQERVEKELCGSGIAGFPVRGDFSAHFEVETLTLRGKVLADASLELVEFTAADGDVPPIEIELERFAGELYDDVESALAKAAFLEHVLSRRIQAALCQRRLLDFLGKVMTRALKSV